MQRKIFLSILILPLLIMACGDAENGDGLDGELTNVVTESSDEFVGEISSRMSGLGGGTDLLTTFAEYERLKRGGEDQFFKAQLERTLSTGSNLRSRDMEKYRSIADIDSTNFVLCSQPSEDGYIGSDENPEVLGFCDGARKMEVMSADDAVRFLSYVLKAEDPESPLRKITSVRLNRKIRLMFESDRPIFHLIVAEKARGAFQIGAPALNTNGLEGGMAASTPVVIPAEVPVANSTVTESDAAMASKPAVKQNEPVPVPTARPLPDLTNLVTSYLDLQEGDNLDGIMALYSNRVRYNRSGNVSKATIRADKAKYYKSWPSRNHQRLSDVTVKRLGNTDEYTARFNYSYTLSDGRNNNAGKVWMELSVKENNGSFLIIGEKGGAL